MENGKWKMEINSFSLSNEELKEINELLSCYGNYRSLSSMSMLDGYLTAIASSPHYISPSSWLSSIWGGAQDQPKYNMTRFIELVMRHYNCVNMTLKNTPQKYNTVLVWIEQEEEKLPMVHDWCLGYLCGVELMPWFPLPTIQSAALKMISEPLNIDTLVQLHTPQIMFDRNILHEQKNNISSSALILHDFFQDQYCGPRC